MEKEGKVQFNFIVRFKSNRAILVNRLNEMKEILENSLPIAKIYKSFYSVVAVQLRVLLCDGANSLLYKLEDSPLLPPLRRNYIHLGEDGELAAIHSNEDMFDWEATPIPLEEWLKQDLMFFKRTVEDIPGTIIKEHFEQIINSIKKKSDKSVFTSCYSLETRALEGRDFEFFVLNEDVNDEQKEFIFNILNEVGYNNLTLFHLIKLVADKIGAHADSDMPTGLVFMRGTEKEYRGYFDEIGLMMLVWIDDFLSREGILKPDKR